MPTSPLPNLAVSLAPPPPIEVVSVMVVLLSSPQAARKTAAAVEPPPTARNFRLVTSICTASCPFCVLALPTGRGAGVDQNPPMATASTPAERDDRTRVAALLTLGSIVSVQGGSALATTLFDEIGSSGAVFLRAL